MRSSRRWGRLVATMTSISGVVSPPLPRTAATSVWRLWFLTRSLTSGCVSRARSTSERSSALTMRSVSPSSATWIPYSTDISGTTTAVPLATRGAIRLGTAGPERRSTWYSLASEHSSADVRNNVDRCAVQRGLLRRQPSTYGPPSDCARRALYVLFGQPVCRSTHPSGRSRSRSHQTSRGESEREEMGLRPSTVCIRSRCALSTIS